METTVHFRSPDPIQNLRVQITLTRLSGPRRTVNTAAISEEDEATKDADDNKKKKKGNKDKDKDDKETDEKENEEGNKKGSRRKNKEKETQKEQEKENKKSGKASASAVLQNDDEVTSVQEVAWQQKIFSNWEIEHYGGLDVPVTMLEQKYKEEVERLGERKEGSSVVIFTYVHADSFTVENEAARTVTTSPSEAQAHLLQAMRSTGPSSTQFQCMCIMAEIGGDEREEKVLVSIKAHPNGSFDMRPGFSPEDSSYRIELTDGAVYEYRVDHLTQKEVGLKKVLKKGRDGTNLGGPVGRAPRHQQGFAADEFIPLPGPSPDAIRLTLMMEIVAARGFEYDNLFVEYFVKLGSGKWSVTHGQNYLKGITHISKTTTYPQEATSTEDPLGYSHKVAHFCFPVELEFVCQEEPLKSSAWPIVYFQVASYDKWDRFRTMGYCSLNTMACATGTQTHILRSWRPMGSVCDRMHTFFVGGAPELADITATRVPAGFRGASLNKYGLSTETSGDLKVRTNVLIQSKQPCGLFSQAKPSSGGVTAAANVNHSQSSTVATAPSPHALKTTQANQPRSMAEIVERARRRLAEAKGEQIGEGRGEKEEVTAGEKEVGRGKYRRQRSTSAGGEGELGGPFSKYPSKESTGIEISLHPVDMTVKEGRRVVFQVEAQATPQAPQILSFQWLKDGEPLEGATENVLRLRGVGASDAGTYVCEVKGSKDGYQKSKSAKLTVQPAASKAAAEKENVGPHISEHPRDITVADGDNANFTVTAQGEEPLAYQWLRDNEEIEGETQPTLILENVDEDTSVSYSCRVTDRNMHTVLSHVATLKLASKDEVSHVQ